jgi:hypothetical protein
MDSAKKPAPVLEDLKAAVMFCYIYGDYFGLYKPGVLAEMMRGISLSV